jgi:2-methylisocitrate lyase-like PEP mutase family enzyme
MPDKKTMELAAKSYDIPMMANIIEGGKTEELSAKDLAEIGYAAVVYPWTLVASEVKSIRDTLENLKKSLTVGAPPLILSYDDVCEGVGFNKYWDQEEIYKI